jgi:hypothetical protein
MALTLVQLSLFAAIAAWAPPRLSLALAGSVVYYLFSMRLEWVAVYPSPLLAAWDLL